MQSTSESEHTVLNLCLSVHLSNIVLPKGRVTLATHIATVDVHSPLCTECLYAKLLTHVT